MSPGILGKKIGMTQVFRPDGQVVPVTLVKAGPCVVVQRKTSAADGYDAVQLGFMEYVKAARINKPETGHLKKAGAEGVRHLKELRLGSGSSDLKVRAAASPQSSSAITSAAALAVTDLCSTARLVRSAAPVSRVACSPELVWVATWELTK